MTTDYQKYRFSDYLKATGLAPLASVPVVIFVVVVLALSSTLKVRSNVPEEVNFIRVALFLNMLTIPTAYISTAIFGAVGMSETNLAKFRPGVPFGAGAGMVCGVIAGMAWILFLTRDNFDISVLFDGFLGSIILPSSLLSGLLAGILFTKLTNRRTDLERGI